MGAIIGFVFGYVLGTKAGATGNDELKAAWKTISSSDEVKDMLTSAFAIGRDISGQGKALLGARLIGGGGDEGGGILRRIA